MDNTQGNKPLPSLEFIWSHLNLEGTVKVGMLKCPCHEDKNASLSIFESRDRSRLLWKCHAGCGGGDSVDLYAMVKGCSRKVALRILTLTPNEIVDDFTAHIVRKSKEALRDDTLKPTFQFSQIDINERIRQLAELRKIPQEGVALAYRRGLLGFGSHEGYAAWVVHDSSSLNIQARRLSGLLWWGKSKSHTMRHSKASLPVGLPECYLAKVVHITEGAPDLIAAHAVIAGMATPEDHSAIGLLGASMHPSKAVFGPLEGKDVVIWAHSDSAGKKAADAWTKSLFGLARSVVVLAAEDVLPGHKDLNDLVASQTGMRAIISKLKEVGHA